MQMTEQQERELGEKILQESLRKVLIKLREDNYLSISLVAQKIEAARSHISMIENGHRSISLEMLYRYAKLFKISLSEIFKASERFIKGEQDA